MNNKQQLNKDGLNKDGWNNTNWGLTENKPQKKFLDSTDPLVNVTGPEKDLYETWVEMLSAGRDVRIPVEEKFLYWGSMTHKRFEHHKTVSWW